MNVCLIGYGLTSLFLAKALANLDIGVTIHFEKKRQFLSKNRTLAISQDNFKFIEEKIIKLKKIKLWPVDKMEIYISKNKKNLSKILDFNNSSSNLFFVVKNNDFYKLLENDLKKNKKIKKKIIRNISFYSKLFKSNSYDLIINCESNNTISKNLFYNKFYKDYKTISYVTTIDHKSCTNKNASQVFTKLGPVAFLPVSKNKTSVVYSIKKQKIQNINTFSQNEFKELIFEYNKNYKIQSVGKFEKFNLNFSLPRKYFENKILAFGDNLHKVHPLAGQGFNMTLRDIKTFIEIITEKKMLGLEINNSIFQEFQYKTKHFNFLFASGIDFINGFFGIENKYFNDLSLRFFNKLNNNKVFKDLFIDYANKGFKI